ncbi:MAG: DUF4234 domain-containing protein [Thermosipho sp. (in: Bacteria)]|nr:DUF4234 domain-containing protein [Thermosipho sp. (in: thermotogales)]MCD6104218.1 DUF4234 domain-containing protein [Thermosipho sp. (in: thermotogales)]
MDITVISFIFSSVIGNIFYFINITISDIFISLSVILFNLLIFLYSFYLKKLKIANLYSIFFAILIINLFSLLPLYLTNSYLTWALAQIFSFVLTLFYLRLLIIIIGSKKSILKMLLFSLLTLGIYSLYFFYSLTQEFKNYYVSKKGGK